MTQEQTMIHLLESSRVIYKEVPTMILGGEPGVGKTRFSLTYVEHLQKLGIFPNLRLILCNSETDKPDFIYQLNTPKFIDVIATGEKDDRPLIIKSQLIKAMEDSQLGTVVVLIDELDKASPEVDTFLLAICEEGICADPMITSLNGGILKAVKENLIILITTNQQRKLNPALSRRGHQITMQFHSKNKMKEIIPMMIKGFAETLSPEQIKFGIDFMYKYRELNPKHTMVQNQLVRLFSQVEYCKKFSDYEMFKHLFKAGLSPYESDLTLVERTIHDLKYISKMFYG